MDNSLSAYWYALSRETPGKAWWRGKFHVAAIARALRINPLEHGAIYAMTPFRLVRIEDKPLILAAHPAPCAFDPIDTDWLNIETVMVWNPVDDTAYILGDVAAQLVGNLTDDANQIHASPRAFFQSWAMRRAGFAIQRQSLHGKSWTTVPTERDEVPGALVIGDLTKITLSPSALPQHIECVGIDPKDFNRAIMRAARLPRATASASHIRKAA